MKIENIVIESLNIAKNAANVGYDVEIKAKCNKAMKSDPSIAGQFVPAKLRIYIRKDVLYLGKKRACKVVLHEIGHYIHYRYLGFKPMYIRRKKKGNPSLYCNSSQKESFAECFADYAYALYKGKLGKIKSSKRLSKMERIIKSLERNT